MYLSVGESTQAAACFRGAIAHDPNCRLAYLSLARVLREVGDLIGALEAFYAAFRLARTAVETILGLSGLLGLVTTEQYDRTIEKMLLDVYQTDGANYQGLALAAAHQIVKKYGVNEVGETEHELDPNDPLVRHYLTKCFNILPSLEYALTACRSKLLAILSVQWEAQASKKCAMKLSWRGSWGETLFVFMNQSWLYRCINRSPRSLARGTA